VLGRAPLEASLFEVELPISEREETIPGWNGMGPRTGRLEVLFAGHIPPDPGEFMSTAGLSRVLEELRTRCDIVIVDTPPMLHVGDAIALSPKVDAMVVVTRIHALRRPMLVELRRLLETTPVPKLGYIATGAEAEDDYAETYYSSYYGPYHQREEAGR
jgi:polysaccharide biosynthesis transport protein